MKISSGKEIMTRTGDGKLIISFHFISLKYGGNLVYTLVLHGDSIILFKSWGPFE